MKVLSKEEGSVQFITEYNEKAIKKRILAASRDEVAVKLVQGPPLCREFLV